MVSVMVSSYLPALCRLKKQDQSGIGANFLDPTVRISEQESDNFWGGSLKSCLISESVSKGYISLTLPNNYEFCSSHAEDPAAL